MRVAIAQIAAIKGNIEKNIENHLKWIKQIIPSLRLLQNVFSSNSGSTSLPSCRFGKGEIEVFMISSPFLR